MSLSYVALSIIALLSSLKRAPDRAQYHDLLPVMFKMTAFVAVDIKDLGHGSRSPVVMLQMGRVQFVRDKVCVSGIPYDFLASAMCR